MWIKQYNPEAKQRERTLCRSDLIENLIQELKACLLSTVHALWQWWDIYTQLHLNQNDDSAPLNEWYRNEKKAATQPELLYILKHILKGSKMTDVNLA